MGIVRLSKLLLVMAMALLASLVSFGNPHEDVGLRHVHLERPDLDAIMAILAI
jgi:predicted small integral membrane protein